MPVKIIRKRRPTQSAKNPAQNLEPQVYCRGANRRSLLMSLVSCVVNKKRFSNGSIKPLCTPVPSIPDRCFGHISASASLQESLNCEPKMKRTRLNKHKPLGHTEKLFDALQQFETTPCANKFKRLTGFTTECPHVNNHSSLRLAAHQLAKDHQIHLA